VFAYRTPFIRVVTGCPDNVYNRTFGCPTPGGTTITVNGLNFGAVQADVSVTVGGNPCTSVALTVAHRTITCALPSGTGQNVTVAVTVAGQTGSADYVDYSSPVIFPNTLMRISVGAVNYSTDTNQAHVVADSMAGGDEVQFEGRYFGSDPGQVLVTYGPVELATLFPCTQIAFTETLIQCRTTAGVGGNMRFLVRVAGVASNLVSDFYSYPPPALTPNTIRFPGGFPSIGLVGNTTQGEEIYFNGQNFGPTQATGHIKVTYKAPDGTTTYTCKMRATTSPNSAVALSLLCFVHELIERSRRPTEEIKVFRAFPDV
jgi:hypothetical protein